MVTLAKFYHDAVTRETVKEYLIEYLREQAVSKAFSGEDTSGLKEAKDAIDGAFLNLHRRFTPPKKKQNSSQ